MKLILAVTILFTRFIKVNRIISYLLSKVITATIGIKYLRKDPKKVFPLL